MKIAFYTICDNKLRNLPNSRNLDFQGFMNSFKKFHPEIPMFVYDSADMAKHGVNYYNAKPIFGKVLSEEYDLVVNVDADHYFFSRCDQILKVDYDVACPANYNETDNLVGIKTTSGINGDGKSTWLVDTKQFLQGGLIASPNKKFWEHYEYATKHYWHNFVCLENDVLNLIAHTTPYNVKYLDGHYNFLDSRHTCWYGCGIINKEMKAVIQDDKIMVEGKPIKAYHFAHGAAKKKYQDVFPEHTHSFIKNCIC